MEHEKSLGYRLLSETVGTPIEILSNDYEEFPGCENTFNTYQEIIFQIKEEDPDDWAIGILFTLSLMSFSFAAPRGISEIHFIPDIDPKAYLRYTPFQGSNFLSSHLTHPPGEPLC